MIERKWGPEELKNEASRTINDAELIKGGAEYGMPPGASRPRLEPTAEQIKTARREGGSSTPEINFDSLKGKELVEATIEITREIFEVMQKFVERQPELAALFELEHELKSLPASSHSRNLKWFLEQHQSPGFREEYDPGDDPEKESRLVYPFYSQSVAHRLFRILYLIDGYDFDKEGKHPECAKDSAELSSAIEKLRKLSDRCGMHTPAPAESPYRILTEYSYDNTSLRNVKVEDELTKLFKTFPAIRHKIQNLGEQGDWANGVSRIIDIDSVGIKDRNGKTLKVPTLKLSKRIDWQD